MEWEITHSTGNGQGNNTTDRERNDAIPGKEVEDTGKGEK
jgi:hypothetical protein